MLIVPTQPVPSQSFSVTLDGQQVNVSLYQTDYGLFIDLLLTNVPLVTGALCLNQEPIIQQPYLGFSGELQFVDTQGTDDPIYTGLGTRFQLAYIEAPDIAAAA